MASSPMSLAPIAVRAFSHRDDIMRLVDLLRPAGAALDKERKNRVGEDPIFATLRVNAAIMEALLPNLDEIEVLCERIDKRVLGSEGAEPWTRARYQAHLARLGLYRGKVDGLPGKLTDEAVAAFQRAKNMQIVDGEVGPATTELLIADGA